jgi:Predicted membrane protein (DUF2232)
MMQIALIGIAAGAASALLFASVASGSLLAIPLFYLAPLPILIAAVGWSHLAGLAAALVAATGLAVVLGGFFFIGFLLGIGLPAWWLGYLALLARSSGPAPDNLEWYPVGRIVVWAAVLAGLVVTIGILAIGTDAESFRSGLRGAIERLFGLRTEAPRRTTFRLPGLGEMDAVDFMVLITPPTAAVVALITNLVALWLAGRVVTVSGRLKRPWPDLSALSFPPSAHALLAAALAATFLPDIAAIIGGVFAAGLLMAYALLGLAVMHALTRGINGRGFILGSIYGAIFIFGWPMLLMSLVGLTDALLDLRARVAASRGPPSLPM